jgi:uncharacterized protein
LRSRLFTCRVYHRRLAPRRHAFGYRIFLLGLDLDELPLLANELRGLRINRRGALSFHESDYLRGLATAVSKAGVASTLKERVRALLAAEGVSRSPGRVVLVTMPRILGYAFNPVSFYFCDDEAGQPLAVIAEVTNTFGETKPYVLGPTCLRADQFRRRVAKNFYVSPFSDVDVAFDFRFAPLIDRLRVQIDDYDASQRTLTSSLVGTPRPLTDGNLALVWLTHPLQTLRVISLIHWHALLLYLKRVPWYPKAARAADQKDFFPAKSPRLASHTLPS